MLSGRMEGEREREKEGSKEAVKESRKEEMDSGACLLLLLQMPDVVTDTLVEKERMMLNCKPRLPVDSDLKLPNNRRRKYPSSFIPSTETRTATFQSCFLYTTLNCGLN